MTGPDMDRLRIVVSELAVSVDRGIARATDSDLQWTSSESQRFAELFVELGADFLIYTDEAHDHVGTYTYAIYCGCRSADDVAAHLRELCEPEPGFLGRPLQYPLPNDLHNAILALADLCDLMEETVLGVRCRADQPEPLAVSEWHEHDLPCGDLRGVASATRPGDVVALLTAEKTATVDAVSYCAEVYAGAVERWLVSVRRTQAVDAVSLLLLAGPVRVVLHDVQRLVLSGVDDPDVDDEVGEVRGYEVVLADAMTVLGALS